MAVPAISLEQARAHVVVKQGLSGRGLETIEQATRASGCLYGTAPTCYLGYSARVAGFVVADLDRELYHRRSLVRLRSMRGSSYCVPVELLPTVAGATADVAGATALDRILRYTGVGVDEYQRVAASVENVMQGQGPMTKGEIRSALDIDVPGRGDALNYIIAVMAREYRVVRATVRGGWRSDSYSYALWQDWVGAPRPQIDAATARVDLARVYLRAYGPATVRDLGWWAGWKPPQALAAADALGDTVTRVSVDGADALVLADDLDALLGVDHAAASDTRLLPVWDAYLMGWQDRRRFVDDASRPLIYDKAGNSTSVLLQDGLAAGVWEMDVDRKGGLEIRIAPFGRVRWKDVEGAASRIASSVGASSLGVERVSRPPRPLVDSPARNAFLAPIRLGTATRPASRAGG